MSTPVKEKKLPTSGLFGRVEINAEDKRVDTSEHIAPGEVGSRAPVVSEALDPTLRRDIPAEQAYKERREVLKEREANVIEPKESATSVKPAEDRSLKDKMSEKWAEGKEGLQNLGQNIKGMFTGEEEKPANTHRTENLQYTNVDPLRDAPSRFGKDTEVTSTSNIGGPVYQPAQPTESSWTGSRDAVNLNDYPANPVPTQSFDPVANAQQSWNRPVGSEYPAAPYGSYETAAPSGPYGSYETAAPSGSYETAAPSGSYGVAAPSGSYGVAAPSGLHGDAAAAPSLTSAKYSDVLNVPSGAGATAPIVAKDYDEAEEQVNRNAGLTDMFKQDTGRAELEYPGMTKTPAGGVMPKTDILHGGPSGPTVHKKDLEETSNVSADKGRVGVVDRNLDTMYTHAKGGVMEKF